jgi:hypothetical protein
MHTWHVLQWPFRVSYASYVSGCCVYCVCVFVCAVFVCVAQEEKALKALKEKAKAGSVGGAGLKKSGKK